MDRYRQAAAVDMVGGVKKLLEQLRVKDTDEEINVYRMKLLGAKVNAVETGTMTLKDAVNEAMREWTNRVDDTHYVLGSVMGPHPFPMVVRDFQSVIGKEIKAQLLEKEGRRSEERRVGKEC